MAVEDADIEGLSPEEAELRAHLRPVARRRAGPLLKRLCLAFTGVDEVAFSRLLESEFEGLVFAGVFETEDGKEFRQVEDLYLPRGARQRWAFVPPAGWDWAQVYWGEDGYLRNVPWTLAAYHSGVSDETADAAGRPTKRVTRFESTLLGYHYRTDPDRKALLRKLWRLVDSIAEREVKEIDRLGRVTDRLRPHMTRFGYDALRWCQQDASRRLLDWHRPTDDWQMPESPWYEGLPGL